MTTTQLYNDNKHLIENVAYQIFNTTGIEYDELVSQGNVIFCLCAERYNQDKNTFAKYLLSALHFALFRFAKHEKKREHYSTYLDDNSHSDISREIRLKTTYQPDYTAIVDATFDNLSNDARYVVDLVLSNKINKPRIFKKDVQNYLHNQDWNRLRIQHAFYEIQSHLQY